MDVKTAFLIGHIDEELYMMQPEGFVDPKDAGKVCKQVSRSWNKQFDQVIKSFGLVQNNQEACVYIRKRA